MSQQASPAQAKQITDVIRKATVDKSFRKQLMSKPRETLEQAGITVKGEATIKVLENSKTTYNLVVPQEKLSPEHQQHSIKADASMPQIARFIITQVQEGSSTKSKLLSNPTEFLRSKGIDIPKSINVNVHQNTAQTKFIVVPHEVGENEELSELELQAVAGGKGAPGLPGGMPGIPGLPGGLPPGFPF